MNSSATINIKADLCRLARFGANISDSHSCFIFLPSRVLHGDDQSRQQARQDALELAGFHTLSSDVLERCRLAVDSGIIGWVSKHHQSIHVSPFEHDSRTLGMYRADQKLKSFIGIPIPVAAGNSEGRSTSGVIACDSKKSYAFSKLQGKLLEDLAVEVANTLRLSLLCVSRAGGDASWQAFLKRAQAVFGALGKNSVDVLRARPENFDALERVLGTSGCVGLIEQIYRLVQQALPPHFPAHRLPNGDIVIIMDNMMSSFYQNKLEAFSQHVARDHHRVSFSFTKASFSDKRYRNCSLEELIASSNTAVETAQPDLKKRTVNEYRRA